MRNTDVGCHCPSRSSYGLLMVNAHQQGVLQAGMLAIVTGTIY